MVVYGGCMTHLETIRDEISFVWLVFDGDLSRTYCYTGSRYLYSLYCTYFKAFINHTVVVILYFVQKIKFMAVMK